MESKHWGPFSITRTERVSILNVNMGHYEWAWGAGAVVALVVLIVL